MTIELQDNHQALMALEKLAFPTRKDEKWRLTSLEEVFGPKFSPLKEKVQESYPDTILPKELAQEKNLLVMVDGIFSPQLSSKTLQEGLLLRKTSKRTTSLSGSHGPEAGEEYWPTYNAAHALDGNKISLEVRPSADNPSLTLVHLTTKNAQGGTLNPQIHIQLTEGAKLNLLEYHYHSSSDENENENEKNPSSFSYLHNKVLNIELAPDSHLEHILLQNGGNQARTIEYGQVHLAERAHYKGVHLFLGSFYSRQFLGVYFQGKKAEAELYGVAALSDQQSCDTHTILSHLQGETQSTQVMKGLLGGKSFHSFSGQICVAPKAQKVDSAQLSKHILLGPKAYAHTKPQLIVDADDVKCAHGATVGRMAENELFYLQSRGIPTSRAKEMLSMAFAYDLLDKISHSHFKDLAHKALVNKVRPGFEGGDLS